MLRITLIACVLATVISLTIAQRPPYAGSRPIGYKDRFRPKPTGGAGGVAATANDIDNRFGGDSRKPSILTVTTVATPTINRRPPTTVIPFRQTTLSHVPYDAHGDVFLVNLLNQRPVDQQPFWFVNYQAIEAHRNG